MRQVDSAMCTIMTNVNTPGALLLHNTHHTHLDNEAWGLSPMLCVLCLFVFIGYLEG